MSEKAKEALLKLVKVKTIVTIVLTAVFAALALTHQIGPEQVIDIFKLVVVFYFGTQVEKGKDN